MNARSDRYWRTSPKFAKFVKFAHSEIHCFKSELCAGGPSFRARIWPTYRDLMRVKNPKRSLWVAETWRSKRPSSLSIHETRKETLDRWWPAVDRSCTQIQCYSSSFFRLWAPKPALEPSTGLPRLREPAPRRLVLFSSTSILLGSWKLRNFLRPINASMKEATAKRPLLKDFNWKLMIFQSRRIVAALPNRPWLSRLMVFQRILIKKRMLAARGRSP